MKQITRVDNRTEADKQATIGFVVATDSFLSGWGQAPRRSIYAIPIIDDKYIDIVLDNMEARSDMKRPRYVLKTYRPKLYDGDHLKIPSVNDIKDSFYIQNYFK